MGKVSEKSPFVNSSKSPLVLSLCDYSGSWSAPFLAAGCRVIQVDPKLKHVPGDDLFLWRGTVADVLSSWRSLPPVWGVLAAPPCTHFTKASNRLWSKYDECGKTSDSVLIVRQIIKLVELLDPSWWALENPPGRLPALVPELGKRFHSFQPCDFGDPYTKQTLLYGRFVPPLPLFSGGDFSCQPIHTDYIQRAPGSGEARQAFRSVTPPGFSRAFAAAQFVGVL